MAKKSIKHPTLDALDRIEQARERLDCAERNLLRAQGWDYTSSTPGYVWMFEKKIGKRTLVASQREALRIERETCGEEYDESEIEVY